VARILATRAALVARRQRRHAYAGIGAEAIRWELPRGDRGGSRGPAAAAPPRAALSYSAMF